MIWAVLNSPLLFRLASRIGAHLDVPMLGTIWDPPEGIGLHFGLDRLSRRLSRRHFANALRRCTRVSVISERMQAEYRALHGIESIVLRHGIAPREQHRIDAAESSLDGELRIGFCGSLYAHSEWHALLKGLDQLGWQSNGRKIRLIVAGKNVPRVFASSPAQFEFLGWRPMDEVVERLSACHFNYLPYWFHPAYTESVRLCFPTKLTAYLTAGRPVLYHGPRDAAVVDFFSRFPVAECCHSLEAGSVADSIRRLANLPDEAYASMIEAGRRAVQEELNLDVFLARFCELMGVDERPSAQDLGARTAEERIPHKRALAQR
jgi:glycosyltransferase involved in cell wall biosynthesis